MKNNIRKVNDRNEPNAPNEESVFARALIFLIKIYQDTVGMMLPRVCRYEPTCSQYAIEAIRGHGVIHGLGLSAWRILRCNPWCRGGYDPVPVRHGVKGMRG